LCYSPIYTGSNQEPIKESKLDFQRYGYDIFE
jgi:hypothetical protein